MTTGEARGDGVSSMVVSRGLLVVGGEFPWGEVGRDSVFTVRANVLIAGRLPLY